MGVFMKTVIAWITLSRAKEPLLAPEGKLLGLDIRGPSTITGDMELTGTKGVSISRKKEIQGNWKGEIPYFCCPKREIFLLSSVG
jgi:hypothetical protein